MSRKSSERRTTVRVEELVDVEGAAEGRREGCRLRIGFTGIGGVGRSLDDLRRAASSSSSNTVASVRVLTGRKWSSVTLGLGWLADLAGAGHPSSSTLMARPICDIGTEAAVFDVPTPGRTMGRPDAEVDIANVL
jgi:hypothetical protein